MSYLEATNDLYKEAALTPDVGLCCTTNPIWELPGLKIPKIMQEMNYGCGSTVHARDLSNNPKMLYVGVGGGMELLQFSYFSRQKGGVIGVDVVDEMLEASRKNFKEAEEQNDWFKSEFVDLKKGDAMNLPVEDNSIDVYTQDLGRLAVVENDQIIGYNVIVGGGMGRTPSAEKTFPALGQKMTFVTPDQVIPVAEADLPGDEPPIRATGEPILPMV